MAFSSYHVVHHGLVTSVTTGPTGGVISPDGTSAYLQIGVAHGAAKLAQVDVATGKVLRVLLTRPAQPTRASPLAIDGRYLLVALGPVAAAEARRAVRVWSAHGAEPCHRQPQSAAIPDPVQYGRPAATAPGGLVTPRGGDTGLLTEERQLRY